MSICKYSLLIQGCPVDYCTLINAPVKCTEVYSTCPNLTINKKIEYD